MITSIWRRLAAPIALAVAAIAAVPQPASAQTPRPVLTQLTPENSVLLLVDYQPQFVFATRSSSIDDLVNNAQGLAKAARAFEVPIVATTITAQGFAGPLLADLQSVIADVQPIDRTVINAWSDPRVREAIRRTGRRKIIIAGLWTDNCVMLPALSALAEGYEVYFVPNASGDYDRDSHERAIDRLVQAGAVPVNWLPVMLEWQSDWANTRTASAVQRILRENARASAAGQQYLGAVRPAQQ